MSGPLRKAGQAAVRAFSSTPGSRVTNRRAARRIGAVRGPPPVISQPMAMAICTTRRAYGRRSAS